MKKNYVLIFGILILLFVGGYFGVLKISESGGKDNVDYNKITPKSPNISLEYDSINSSKELNGLKLVKSTTQENEKEGVKSINKTSLYRLDNYDIQIIEQQIIEKDSKSVEESILTTLTVFKNNIEVHNNNFKGSLVSIGAQLDKKLLLQFEDVWDEGNSVYEYYFEKNLIKEISKNDFKFIETSDSIWIIHYPNKIKLISLKTETEKVLQDINYKFLFNNLSLILFQKNNSIISYNNELNKKWEYKDDNLINIVKKSYLDSKSFLYLYDEKSKNILQLNIANGELINKIILEPDFYLIEMLSISKINGIAYIEKNDSTKERYLRVINQEKDMKIPLEVALNSISQIENTIELKNTYDDTKSFTFDLSEFN